MPLDNDLAVKVLAKTLSGGIKGGAIGAAASIATGAAVFVTAPGWLPWIGGSAVVVMTTVSLWGLIGSASGAITAGARAYCTYKREERQFKEAFLPPNQQQGDNINEI